MDFEGTCTTSYDFEKKAMDVYADINFTDDSDYCLSGTINFDDLKKGKAISAELSDCYIESSSDDFVISLSGDYEITTEDIEFKSPPKETREIFEFDQDEMDDFTNEVYENLMNSPIMGLLY